MGRILNSFLEEIWNESEVLAKIKELGVLAVIRGPSADLTVKMVEALVLGGITGIEITYSTPDAEDVVRTLVKQFGAEDPGRHGHADRPRAGDIRQERRRELPRQPGV